MQRNKKYFSLSEFKAHSILIKGTETVLSLRPGGCVPSMAGQHRREKRRIPERLPGFRKASAPDPFGENRIVDPIGPT
jgi:hypothetical protein